MKWWKDVCEQSVNLPALSPPPLHNDGDMNIFVELKLNRWMMFSPFDVVFKMCKPSFLLSFKGVYGINRVFQDWYCYYFLCTQLNKFLRVLKKYQKID